MGGVWLMLVLVLMVVMRLRFDVLGYIVFGLE